LVLAKEDRRKLVPEKGRAQLNRQPKRRLAARLKKGDHRHRRRLRGKAEDLAGRETLETSLGKTFFSRKKKNSRELKRRVESAAA